MRRFRYLPHTADMEFRAYGSNFRNAIENAASALLNIMTDLKSLEKDKSAEKSIAISESARNERDLVWFTLQDILSKAGSMQLSALRFRIVSLNSKKKLRLRGRLIFKKAKKDYSLLSVKAVTPHDMSVSRKNGRVSINVVVDV